MRRASRLFVFVALAACAVGTGGAAAAKEAADPDVWAHDFCAGGAEWINDLTTQSGDLAIDLANPDADEVSGALVAFFKRAATSTKQYATRLRDAGVPDVPDGKRIARALTKALTKTRRAFARAKTDAAKLAAGDGDDLQTGLDAAQAALQDGLDNVASSTSAVLERSGSRRLGEALRDEKACRRFLPPPST